MKFFQIHGIVPHERAGWMQTEYLYSKGHRNIGYAFPSEPSLELVATERLEGVRKACTHLGIEQPNVQYIDIDSPDSVYDALTEWGLVDERTSGDIDASSKMTAVAAHNDEIGMMLCSAVTARGYQMGSDLAVIGVDDIPTARFTMTTVAIDVELWAESVAVAVIDLIEGRPLKEVRGDFLTLIERSSA